MGIKLSTIRDLFSFKKNPDVYKKELEKINNEIFTLEQQKASMEFQYNLIKQVISSYSKLIFIMFTLIFFFSTLPSTFSEYILFCGPLLLIYILIQILKLSIRRYYEYEIQRSLKKLAELLSRRNKIFEEIKEKISFTDAKSIIEEYSCLPEKHPFKQLVFPQPTNRIVAFSSWTNEGQERLQSSKNNFSPWESTNGQAVKRVLCDQDFVLENGFRRRESSLDSVIRYVLNEEKDTALICKYCGCHNGLALEEEFNFMNFRCCRCHRLNKAKQAVSLAIEN